MRGEKPTLQDFTLEFEEQVLPANLLSEETLSSDADPEEEEQQPYTVDTYCHQCNTGVRIVVVATTAAVRTLQLLLLQELAIVCAGCAKQRFRHGRS
uniref:Protein E7 n=1 Tax=Human papillomavirus TaxID=10566 RepID=A0A346TIC1_9PAPI|nr:E7 protein [Human papillomavirus]